MSTKKTEEGEKYHKVEIETIKQEIEVTLKKVRLRTKQIDEIDRDLVGISDKEIKEINKKATGRKPDPKIIADAAYHKYDTSKIFKDDKLLKSIKTGFLKALTQPKKGQQKKGKPKKGGKVTAGSASQVQEDGDPAAGDEMDPEKEAGQPDAEGMDPADGEPDADAEQDAEGADGDPADADQPEADADNDPEGAQEPDADGDPEAEVAE